MDTVGHFTAGLRSDVAGNEVQEEEEEEEEERGGEERRGRGRGRSG